MKVAKLVMSSTSARQVQAEPLHHRRADPALDLGQLRQCDGIHGVPEPAVIQRHRRDLDPPVRGGGRPPVGERQLRARRDHPVQRRQRQVGAHRRRRIRAPRAGHLVDDPATPSRRSIDHAAATSPNARCRVRSGDHSRRPPSPPRCRPPCPGTAGRRSSACRPPGRFRAGSSTSGRRPACRSGSTYFRSYTIPCRIATSDTGKQADQPTDRPRLSSPARRSQTVNPETRASPRRFSVRQLPSGTGRPGWRPQ